MMIHSVLVIFIGSGMSQLLEPRRVYYRCCFVVVPCARRRTSNSGRWAGKTQRIVGPRSQIVLGKSTLPTSISYQCPGPELATKVKRPARLNKEPSAAPHPHTA